MGTGDILLGVALRWTSIPSRGGGGQYFQLLHDAETGISSSRVGPLGSTATLPSSKVASPAPM